MPSFDLNRALARAHPELPALLFTAAAAAEGPLWAVGGFVRDLVAGRVPADLDLAVAGGVKATADSLAGSLGGSPFALDEERETYRVTLPAGAPLSTIDISLLRAPTIEADLADRDFTVNAMAAAITPAGLGSLIDPFGGRADLRRRLVRVASDSAFDNDPLRLLRAVRIATELEFEIEPATAAAVRTAAPRVLESAGERRREEIMRMMASPAASRGLRLLDATGLLDVIFPESALGRGVEQPSAYHYFDVLDHGIEAVGVIDVVLSTARPRAVRQRAMRDAFWAALSDFPFAAYFAEPLGGQTRLALTKFATFLHDVSKPETRTVEESGKVRFLGHPEKGAAVARDVCHRLRFGNRETAFVSKLVEEHLRPAQLSQSGAPTDRAIFRFFRDVGEAAPAVLVLSLADAAAAVGPPLTLPRWQAHLNYVAYVLERGQGLVLGRPFDWSGGKRHFVSGDTLIRELRLAPGPLIGRLLSAIDEAAAGGELTSEEDAIDLARRLTQSPPSLAGRQEEAGAA